VAFVTLNILDKLFEPPERKVKRTITFVVVAAIIVCGILLKREANHAKLDIIDANAIKSFMIAHKQRYKSLKGLSGVIVFSSDDSLHQASADRDNKISQLRKLVKNHPDQFVISEVSEDGARLEGLEVIDERSGRIIDSAIEKRLPYYQDLIVDFMLRERSDSLSYDEINTLDYRLETNVLELVISNSKELLLPLPTKNGRIVILNRPLLDKSHCPPHL
jgi:hypothetical protein